MNFLSFTGVVRVCWAIAAILCASHALAQEDAKSIDRSWQIRPAAGLGLNVACLYFNSAARFDLRKGTQEASVKETLYFALHASLPDRYPGLSLIADISFRNINSEIVYRDMVPGEALTFVSNKFRLDCFANHLFMRYTHPGGDIKPFFQLGLFHARVFSHEQSRFFLYRDGESEFRETTAALNPLRRSEIGWVSGGGIEYEKVMLELRFTHGNGFSGSGDDRNQTFNLFFLAGYRF
ncbi:MAG: hypothetical protein JJU28_18730 [Cyclobacteriaceae bacterium]|nr:hypothetical protein [Cyclobacteriaceae bacterium]